MKIILDTSILIDLFRKTNKSKAYYNRILDSNNEFCISVITYWEFKIGIKNELSMYWNSFFNNTEILNIDIKVTEVAIELYSKLKQNNKLIELADLLIASTALAHSLPIATLNKKHFERIPELQLI